LNNNEFNPATLTNNGIRIQFNKDNSTRDSLGIFTALTNNLGIGTIGSFIGSPSPIYKFNEGYKGWASFISGANAYIGGASAVGTQLFADATGFSFSFWVKPRDGQPSTTNTIFHDIQNTGSPANSRIGIGILAAGTINAFISIGGTTVNATTNTAIFSDNKQYQSVHVAITFTNGELIRIYINGVLQSLAGGANGNISALNLANYINATNIPLWGATRTGASTFTNYFAGMLREFVVQKGIIYSQTDISNLMTN